MKRRRLPRPDHAATLTVRTLVHAKRCVDTSLAAGMTGAAVPAEADLPVEYDPESGQEWTRSRKAYLLHDIGARQGSA